MPVTILELACYRADLDPEREAINGGVFAEVELQLLGGCAICGATIAAYNACPSRSGYWKCLGCIDGDGFDTVEEADVACGGPIKADPAAIAEHQGRPL